MLLVIVYICSAYGRALPGRPQQLQNESLVDNTNNAEHTTMTDSVSVLKIDGRRYIENTQPTAAVHHQTNPPTRYVPLLPTRAALYVDDFFLPYMGASEGSSKGDWVLNDKDSDIAWSIMPWKNWGATNSGPPDTLHRWCGNFHDRFNGEVVCGYRLNQSTWKYVFKTFNNWCDMEKENKLNYWERMYEP
ncbi:uncharacterized protein LOC134803659 [Cydia splendana]|uniref:uncharacterized protein LOC134803659 n=1 Tax=Cydia splendana TaxID=1100963 RepID=UPI00300C60AD